MRGLIGFSGTKWSQHRDEVDAFVRLLQAEGVRSYLEIGARHGDTFHFVMRHLPRGSRGLAVDLPDAQWGLAASDVALGLCLRDLQARGYRVKHIIGDSHDEGVRARVAAHAPFDAALIDADHRYAPLRMDWLDYSPLARLVALHDIDGEGVKSAKSGDPIEVPRLWRELEGDPAIARRKAIIGKRRGLGIGVAWMARA